MKTCLIDNTFGILISRAFSQLLSFCNLVCRLIGATECWDTVAVCLWLWLCRGFFILSPHIASLFYQIVASDADLSLSCVNVLYSWWDISMSQDWYEHSLMNSSRLSSASSSSCFERFREITLVWRIRYVKHWSSEAR